MRFTSSVIVLGAVASLTSAAHIGKRGDGDKPLPGISVKSAPAPNPNRHAAAGVPVGVVEASKPIEAQKAVETPKPAVGSAQPSAYNPEEDAADYAALRLAEENGFKGIKDEAADAAAKIALDDIKDFLTVQMYTSGAHGWARKLRLPKISDSQL